MTTSEPLEEELKAIEARLAAITPGEWEWYDRKLHTNYEKGQYAVGHEVLRLENCGDYDAEPSIEGREADMVFMAAAPSDVRTLVSALHDARAALAAANEMVSLSNHARAEAAERKLAAIAELATGALSKPGEIALYEGLKEIAAIARGE